VHAGGDGRLLLGLRFAGESVNAAEAEFGQEPGYWSGVVVPVAWPAGTSRLHPNSSWSSQLHALT
jgi:hypothetical protein